jgi:hypothetical protein
MLSSYITKETDVQNTVFQLRKQNKISIIIIQLGRQMTNAKFKTHGSSLGKKTDGQLSSIDMHHSKAD